MKRILITALLMIGLSIVAGAPFIATTAQAPPANAGGTDKNGSPPAALPAETLLKIRDLQLADANRRLKMQKMEADYQKLADEQKADSARLTEIVTAAAKVAGVDPAKYLFDLEQLKFVPRTAPAQKSEVSDQRSEKKP